jgi:hypothetical protein
VGQHRARICHHIEQFINCDYYQLFVTHKLERETQPSDYPPQVEEIVVMINMFLYSKIAVMSEDTDIMTESELAIYYGKRDGVTVGVPVDKYASAYDELFSAMDSSAFSALYLDACLAFLEQQGVGDCFHAHVLRFLIQAKQPSTTFQTMTFAQFYRMYGLCTLLQP